MLPPGSSPSAGSPGWTSHQTPRKPPFMRSPPHNDLSLHGLTVMKGAQEVEGRQANKDHVRIYQSCLKWLFILSSWELISVNWILCVCVCVCVQGSTRESCLSFYLADNNKMPHEELFGLLPDWLSAQLNECPTITLYCVTLYALCPHQID